MKNSKTDLSVYKKTLLLAVPIMIQNGITNAVALVDNLMVSSQGDEAITAVSMAGQLLFVFNLAIFGAMSGPGIFGAQYYGSNDTEGVRKVFRIKIWAAFLCSLIGGLLFFFCDDFLIGLYMKGEAGSIDKALTLDFAKNYLRIMILQIPFFAITQVYSTSLRETNESLIPMISGVVSVVVDVFLNYCLIYGNLGFPELGVNGAAIATVLARVAEFSVIFIWSHLRRKKHTFLIGIYKTLLVPWKFFLPIFKKSVPIMINEFLWASAMAAMTQNYSTRGMDVVEGLTISNNLCNLMNVVFIAMGHAVGIIIGQMLGAKEFEKAKKNSISLMWFSGGICVLLSVALCIISGWFPTLYNTTDVIRQKASTFIIITAIFFPLQGFLNSLYFTLRSGGKTVVTFLFDSVFSWTVGVSTAHILAKYTNLGIFGIYTIVQAVDFIKVIIGYILIKKGVWITNIVSKEEND